MAEEDPEYRRLQLMQDGKLDLLSWIVDLAALIPVTGNQTSFPTIQDAYGYFQDDDEE